MFTLYLYFEDTLFANCYAFVVFVQLLGNVGMLITGTFNRWSHEGQVCAGVYTTSDAEITDGPYLPKAASFMKLYLIFLWICSILICCALCGCVGVGIWWTRQG